MKKSEYLDQYLPLKKPEILWQEFNESTRRTIRKAIEKGLVIKRVDDESLIQEVYNLQIDFGKKVGILEFSYNDYLEIWKKLNSLGFFEIFIAKKNEETLAFMTFLNFKDKVLYRTGASSEKGKKIGAHRLITWEVLRWSYQKGYKIFDFGPSGLLEKNGEVEERFRGLVDYKSFFNSIKIPFSQYYFPRSVSINKIKYQTVGIKIGKKVIRYIPKFILGQISTFLIKKFM